MKIYAAILTLLFSFNSIADEVLETFGRLSLVKDIKVSPKGTHVAYLRDVNASYYLIIQSLYEPQKQPVVFSMAEAKIRGFTWANNDRILFYVTQPNYSRGDKETFTMHRAGLLNTEDSSIVWPFIKGKFHGRIGRAILRHTLPSEPDHVLMSSYYSSSIMGFIPGIFKVRLSDGELEQVFTEEKGSSDWTFDKKGNVLSFEEYKRKGDQYVTKIRFDAEDEFEFLMVKEDGKSKYFEPSVRSIDPENKTITYFERRDDNIFGMFTAKVEHNHVVSKKVALPDSIYDMDRYITGPDGTSIIGFTVVKDYSEEIYQDREFAQVYADLTATFPGAEVGITSYSDDLTKFVARISSYEYPEHYYLYDLKQGSLSPLGAGFPTSQNVKLGKVTKFEYKAKDGLNIESYLTLPTATTEEKPKLIVMPHGGPESRDSMGFDWMRQFYAAKGYAVFQPNFRGSDGYGKQFAEKGYGEWGRLMQQDVDDGVQELVKQGLVDAEKICVVGGSYGGYVAMMAAVSKPDTYKCAVSFAGVSELGAMYYHTEQQKGGLGYWKQSIGSRYDSKTLKAHSPLTVASSDSSPIMLIHGDKDTVVPIFQSEKMYKRLKKLRVKTEYHAYEGADHWFSSGETRKKFLSHSIKFIEKHID